MNDGAREVLERDLHSAGQVFRRVRQDLKHQEEQLADAVYRALRGKRSAFSFAELEDLTGLEEEELHELQGLGYRRMAAEQDREAASR